MIFREYFGKAGPVQQGWALHPETSQRARCCRSGRRKTIREGSANLVELDSIAAVGGSRGVSTRSVETSPPAEINLPEATMARPRRISVARYPIEFKPRALKDLRAIPPPDRRRILEKLELLADDLQGDVKKLTNFTPEYRLRVGPWRVLFEVDGKRIVIYRIVRRDKAYN